MKSIITNRIFFHLAVIILLATTMASHSRGLWPGDDWYGRAGYFIFRFSLETIEFVGCYYLLRVVLKRLNTGVVLFLALLLSWPIFVLSITMIDIVLGQPELVGASLYGDQGALITEIFDEMYWIFPKHLSFCALIALINFRVDYSELFKFRFGVNTPNPSPASISDTPSSIGTTDTPLIKALSNRYRESPLRVQAQEHYIKVSTCLGTELILYQFGQALEDLKNATGLQVHRSYWVARDNIVGWTRQKNNIQLELKYGEPVPVSRRFEQAIREQFSPLSEATLNEI
jgi:hypothetical protein